MAPATLADQNCTGKLKNSGASNHSIGYYIDGAYRGEVIAGKYNRNPCHSGEVYVH